MKKLLLVSITLDRVEEGLTTAISMASRIEGIKQNFEIDVLLGGNPADERGNKGYIEGVKYIRLFSFIKEMWIYFKENINKYDAILLHANPFELLEEFEKISERFPDANLIHIFPDALVNTIFDVENKKHIIEAEKKIFIQKNTKIVTNEYHKKHLISAYPEIDPKLVKVIPHMYVPTTKVKEKGNNIVCIGTMYGNRRPENFIKAFDELLTQKPEFKKYKLVISGNGVMASAKFVVNKENINFIGHIPFEEAQEYERNAHLLVNIPMATRFGIPIEEKDNVDDVFLPTKVVQFLKTGNPILTIHYLSNGPSTDLMKETNNFSVFNEKEAIKEKLNEILEKKEFDINLDVYEEYNTYNAGKKFTEVIKSTFTPKADEELIIDKEEQADSVKLKDIERDVIIDTMKLDNMEEKNTNESTEINVEQLINEFKFEEIRNYYVNNRIPARVAVELIKSLELDFLLENKNNIDVDSTELINEKDKELFNGFLNFENEINVIYNLPTLKANLKIWKLTTFTNLYVIDKFIKYIVENPDENTKELFSLINSSLHMFNFFTKKKVVYRFINMVYKNDLNWLVFKKNLNNSSDIFIADTILSTLNFKNKNKEMYYKLKKCLKITSINEILPYKDVENVKNNKIAYCINGILRGDIDKLLTTQLKYVSHLEKLGYEVDVFYPVWDVYEKYPGLANHRETPIVGRFLMNYLNIRGHLAVKNNFKGLFPNVYDLMSRPIIDKIDIEALKKKYPKIKFKECRENIFEKYIEEIPTLKTIHGIISAKQVKNISDSLEMAFEAGKYEYYFVIRADKKFLFPITRERLEGLGDSELMARQNYFHDLSYIGRENVMKKFISIWDNIIENKTLSLFKYDNEIHNNFSEPLFFSWCILNDIHINTNNHDMAIRDSDILIKDRAIYFPNYKDALQEDIKKLPEKEKTYAINLFKKLDPFLIENEEFVIEKDAHIKNYGTYIDNGAGKLIVVFQGFLSVYKFDDNIDPLTLRLILQNYHKTYHYFNLSKKHKEYDYLYVEDNFDTYTLWYKFIDGENKLEEITEQLDKKIDSLPKKYSPENITFFGTSKGASGALMHGMNSNKVDNVVVGVPQVNLLKFTETLSKDDKHKISQTYITNIINRIKEVPTEELENILTNIHSKNKNISVITSKNDDQIKELLEYSTFDKNNDIMLYISESPYNHNEIIMPIVNNFHEFIKGSNEIKGFKKIKKNITEKKWEYVNNDNLVD